LGAPTMAARHVARTVVSWLEWGAAFALATLLGAQLLPPCCASWPALGAP